MTRRRLAVWGCILFDTRYKFIYDGSAAVPTSAPAEIGRGHHSYKYKREYCSLQYLDRVGYHINFQLRKTF